MKAIVPACYKVQESRPLDDLSKTIAETDERMQPNQGGPPGGCAFLTYMSHISRDGRLRREFCSGGHRGFFGNFVVTGARENIFSVQTGQLLGFVKEPNDHPPAIAIHYPKR